MPTRQALINHARPVTISTRDSAHILTANMPTNAGAVLETIHRQVVQQSVPSDNNFYPLPNCVVTPISVNKLSEFFVSVLIPVGPVHYRERMAFSIL